MCLTGDVNINRCNLRQKVDLIIWLSKKPKNIIKVLRTNFKPNYLFGIILKPNDFLPSNSTHSTFPWSLLWIKAFFHHNKGTTRFNQVKQVSVPNSNFKKFLVLLEENGVTSKVTWLNEARCSEDEFKNIS